ncbi:MAG TPA: hypothetical protein VNK89_06755 [Thermoflexus sp.]|nr:hypothetical protein [Thermoflexus sp.]
MAVCLLRVARLEPKQVFGCAACDPPGRRPRVRWRYRFVLADGSGREEVYGLPCAAERLGMRQEELRRRADQAREEDKGGWTSRS